MACSNQGLLVIWGVIDDLQKARELCAGEHDILAEIGKIEMQLFEIATRIARIVESEHTAAPGRAQTVNRLIHSASHTTVEAADMAAG